MIKSLQFQTTHAQKKRVRSNIVHLVTKPCVDLKKTDSDQRDAVMISIKVNDHFVLEAILKKYKSIGHKDSAGQTVSDFYNKPT